MTSYKNLRAQEVSGYGFLASSGTLLELTDTPQSYDDEKYLKSTTSGTVWVTISGGIINHGDLLGLDTDDHVQYLLTNGGRELSADWSAGDARKISIGDLDITTLTSGSVLFIGNSGEVSENNNVLFFEEDNGYGKLAVGSTSHMSNTFQSVNQDGITNMDNIKALVAVRNEGTSNNNFAGFSMQTVDTAGNVYSGGRLISEFTSHASGAVSADVIFETRHAGTRSEKMKLSSDGMFSLLNGASINEISVDTTLVGNSDDAVPTEKATKTYVDSVKTIVTQQAFQNVGQNDIVFVTHNSDVLGTRVSQILELNPESQGLTNTLLDFDLTDESDFIQEDSVSGTDFISGSVLLYAEEGDSYGERQKVFSSDIEAYDYFGASASVYGDTAVVGANGESTGGGSAGAAYIFTRSGSIWTEQQKIQSSDREAGDNFGCDVSIYEDTIVVGAYGEDTGAAVAGAAYIFTKSGSTWTEQQKIQASDRDVGDQFGAAVSIYEDTVVVGSHGEDTGGADAGAAYIFTRSDSTWLEQQKITSSGIASSDYFGWSVSIYADTVIVGAYAQDTGGADAGASYVFTRSGSTWTEQQRILASDKAAGDHFGYFVAIYGETVVVGAKDEDTSAGASYVFTRSGASWTQQQKLTASDKAANKYFGHTSSIYGDTIVVGDQSGQNMGNYRGASYIFTRSGSIWSEQQKMVPLSMQSNDRFSESVSIYEDTVVVGSHTNSGSVSLGGAAYIFSSDEYPLTPKYVTTSDANHLFLIDVPEINSCTITSVSGTDTSVKCLASFDGRSTWQKWGGSSWSAHTGGLTNLQTGNTMSEFESGFTNLTIASGTDHLDFAFDLATTNSGHTPTIDLVTLNYDENGFYRNYNTNSNYMIDNYSTTQTKITKMSTDTKSIKVNIII